MLRCVWHWDLQPVHPRACGEHIETASPFLAENGSSPRLRGTLQFAIAEHNESRFIPAPAGNIVWRRGCPSQSTVHPRACGEHFMAGGFNITGRGSSPRLRGTSDPCDAAARPRRFIPAPAGNIVESVPPGALEAVHPRACGEHRRRYKHCRRPIGSSPRLRGTSDGVVLKPSGERFIPAPAGNISFGSPSALARPVHPRACGEHTSSRMQSKAVTGSSPRLRGTSSVLYGGRYFERFIPAPAGNMSTCTVWPRSSSVHPRACGEHT